MRIGVTGGTGFLGRYVLRQLLSEGAAVRAWRRSERSLRGLGAAAEHVDWIAGELGDADSCRRLAEGCTAVVHAALYRPGAGFRGSEGELLPFVEKNLVGTLQLFESCREAGVERIIFISTCAVHEVILEDRPLDETHPLWPKSHYGAHKAAIEKFVHSFGFGDGYQVCALRPTGIYGVAAEPSESRWFELIGAVARGERAVCAGGGKEVHAADVARAVSLLLRAPGIAGQSYNCCDMYISQRRVAELARELSGSSAEIAGEEAAPRHNIETGKLRALGMVFGGEELLRRTVQELLAAI